MNMPFSVRVVLALMALAALAMVAGRELAPTWPLSWLLGAALGGSVALGLAVALGAWAWGSLAQALLQRGARDAGWGWFNADPPSLPPRRKQD